MKKPTPAALARRFVARSLAAGLLLAQPALFAQTATPAAKPKDDKAAANEPAVVLEKFQVVAGFRGSLAAAAEIKASKPEVTEVIAAEDIGKLPDVSIADSLTRVTGLATQRTNGRSQAINIRGLSGDFTTGMLNGREQVTTAGNRSVEFDQYPAELLNGVVVYKTASASLTGQGLAGSVDMLTVQPLSKGRRVIATNAYYEWTQLGQLTPGVKSKGNRFNLSYVDQVADGKVGIALGFAHSTRPFEGQQFQAWGYPTDNAGNFVLGGTKSYVRSSNLDRDGGMAVIEFKPSENIHSTVDLYVSRFEEKQFLRGMEIPLWWSGAQLQPGGTVAGGLVTNEVYKNVQPVVRNDVFKRNDSPKAIGWNLKLGEKSAWPVTFDAGYSEVSRRDFNLETWSGVGSLGNATNPDTVTVKLIPGHIPVITTTLNYADGNVLKVTDPQGWQTWKFPGQGAPGYVKEFNSKDQLGQFKLFTKHGVGTSLLKEVEFGVSYTDRYKRDGEGPSGFPVLQNNAVSVALPAKVGTTDMSYLGLGPIYAYDPLAAYDNGLFKFVPNTGGGIVANRFQIEEKITQFYAQFNLDTKAGDLPLTGNLGLRGISVDQSSKGYSANGDNLNTVSDGTTYTQFAPSLNLTLKATSQTLVRLSLARQLARPRMYDLRASRTWGYDPTLANSTDLSRSPWSGGGGNPKLKPWQSDSVDLSIEHYFKDNMGYIALAGFHKKLLNFIYEQRALADFSGYPVQGPTPALKQGVISQPVNGDGGAIKGFELTLSLASELLSKDIRGFGVVLGGAYTDSSVKPWGPSGATAPIAGLSRKVANATLYYERAGFSARVSEHYRSENRQYITTFGVPSPGGDVNPNGGFSVAQPEKVVDAQVSYAIQSGSAKGLTFFVQAYNLNNEPLVTYNNNDPRQVINYQKYGASYSLGASYKF
ncbi:MAG: TonB-dependent receptor [Verrucomicrobia bacterium]|nr:TonB-dependent receptor [Verrucomicrobiota bacterium]